MTAHTIENIIQRCVVTCSANTSIREATKLMYQKHCSSIVVMNGTKPIGIWTEADSLKVDLAVANNFGQPISDVMTSSLLTFSPELSLDDAALVLKEEGIRHLIIVDDEGNLLGMASQTDIIAHQDAKYFLSMTPISAILPESRLYCLDIETQLNDAINTMRDHRLDAVVISKDSTPCGLISERDVVRLIATDQTTISVAEVMSSPLLSVPDNMSLLAVRSFMEKRHIRHLGVENSAGCVIGLISFSDILKRIEQSYINKLRGALAQSNQNLAQQERSLHLAHALIEATEDGIMVTNANSIIQSVNPAFSILTGYSEEEVLGKPASIINSGKHGPDFYQRMWNEIDRKGKWQGEIWNRRKNGEIYPEWLTITKVKEPGSDQVLYAGIFNDISERKATESMIENLAYYDPLTQLPNRQLLMDRLDEAIKDIADADQLAVLFVDIDHFKRINDSLGHTFGDEVLREISKRLQSCIDTEDTMARIGGDELIVMMPNITEPAVVYRKAQSIIEALEAPLQIESKEIYITASVGCAVYPHDGLTREELLKNADTAMYRAKSDGRNRVILYSADMNEQSQLQLAFENKLRNALKNDELFLVYQPKVNALSETMVGVEALVRWQQPELGLVSPDRFIGLAEDIGIIDAIGYWVLKTAMEQGAKWVANGLDELTVSVNVSIKQFDNQDMPTQIKELLVNTGLPARNLDIEVTESHMMKNFEKVIRDLAALRSLGVTISMDDFGTGYSSLSMLTQIPLDNLKIDRSFIQGIPHKNDSASLVSTIIIMAKNLGLEVVAEGVEEAEQLAFLRQLGCQQIQGYYYSKPLPPEQIIEFARR